MTYSHIWIQKTYQASYCFSKGWWCSRSPFDCLALYLLVWKYNFSFWDVFDVLVLYSIIHMTSSHIWLQNTNQASYCLSKLWWWTQSPYESLPLYLLTRKHYFSFSKPVAIYFLYYIINVTYSHISLQNTNQSSYCFSKLWWCSQSLYESLALYPQTRKHYFSFWESPAILVLIVNHIYDIYSYLTLNH